MFAEGFYATQLFPYGPWMTESLRGSLSAVGPYTGLLYTAQSSGMLATAYFWAVVSNRYGRRVCLLVGLGANTVLCSVLALSTDYWCVIVLRVATGLLNSNLAIMRTALRETFDHEGADDTWAFSALSVAFGAASVCGPSYGGVTYGAELPGTEGWWQPWSVANFTCAALYGTCLVVTFLLLPETAFLAHEPVNGSNGKSPKADGTPGPGLLQDLQFLLLLAMGGGHSYVFTGWEVSYPLIARLPQSVSGEHWNTREIGFTFLVGSLFLMPYSLVLYPKIAARVKVVRIWWMSALSPLMAMLILPRLVTYLCSTGTVGDSPLVVVLNYGTQVLISMLLGSGFISIQLLLNTYVAGMPDAKRLLALANSFLVSTQALVRAVSPISTGALFTLGLRAEQTQPTALMSRFLAFDHLAITGFVTLVLCALVFERRQMVIARALMPC